MIKFFTFLLFFTKAYANPYFYPTVSPTSHVFNLPPVSMLPWCPPNACASYLSNQALIIPQASTQSYSIPMLLLNPLSSAPNSSNNYERIYPDFQRERNSGVSRSYFRNSETGDIQVQENGQIVGEGTLTYIPLEDLTENTRPASPTAQNNPTPQENTRPASPTAQNNPTPQENTTQNNNPETNSQESRDPAINHLNVVGSLQQAPDESFLPQPITAPSQNDKDNLRDVISTILSRPEASSNTVPIINTDRPIRATETSLPEDLRDKCLIGGLLRERLSGGQCPTTENGCSGQRDGFRCGPIFNRVCIRRTPINSISRRCNEASQGQALSTENYQQLLANDPVAHYCEAHPENTNCQRYPQLRELQVATTEASYCENCEGEESTNEEAVIDVSSSLLTIPFGELLSNTLYDRARCSNYNGRCSSHDQCVPGENDSRCRRSNGACRGTKGLSQSLGRCAGYLNKGLNLVLREYLQKYCENENESMGQCSQNTEPSICNTNFVMPSALCALNLDGIDRIDGETVTNRSVRNRCNGLSRQFPTHITIGGERIPLFQKINIPSDPNDLPVGSIVVSQSRTRLGRNHGHIELKTNKQCNGSPCFCSDFCTNRDRDDYNPNGTFPYSVAFQLNPEVARALETL